MKSRDQSVMHDDGRQALVVVANAAPKHRARWAARTVAEAWRADPEMLLERGAVESILLTYMRLHADRTFAHWLWASVERVAAGDDVDAVMRDMGYVRATEGAVPPKDAPCP